MIDGNIIIGATLLVFFLASAINAYFLILLKRQLREEILTKHFDVISKEIKVLEKTILLTDSNVSLNSAKVDALEKVLSAIISSSGGFNPNDDTMH